MNRGGLVLLLGAGLATAPLTAQQPVPPLTTVVQDPSVEYVRREKSLVVTLAGENASVRLEYCMTGMGHKTVNLYPSRVIDFGNETIVENPDADSIGGMAYEFSNIQLIDAPKLRTGPRLQIMMQSLGPNDVMGNPILRSVCGSSGEAYATPGVDTLELAQLKKRYPLVLGGIGGWAGIVVVEKP